MRSLYLRIYLTVLLALGLFALASGWLVQRHFEHERERFAASAQQRADAWGELLQRALPGASAAPHEQAAALNEWAGRLRLALALDDARGQRIGTSDAFQRREADSRADPTRRAQAVPLDDGRTLWIWRPLAGHGVAPGRGGPGAGVADRSDRIEFAAMPGRHGAPGAPGMHAGPWLLPPGGLGIAALLLVLFVAVAAGAWPVVRRLTRRLEALKRGVEAFGAGALHQRVAEDGRDEVAALGASFNHAAARIEALLHSHRSLLANASHELRSPLARLKMALALLDEAAPDQRAALQREIRTDIAELDALVEEVLLTSRLDAAAALEVREPVALLPLLVEEAARVGAVVNGDDVQVPGDERLLRRAARNLLENARRYGGNEVQASVAARPGASGGRVELRICDRGPGVPEADRDRIFEPFFRLPGHAEFEGGVGLGLSLVRQIALRHGGSVRCEARAGGGSCFVLDLPAV